MKGLSLDIAAFSFLVAVVLMWISWELRQSEQRYLLRATVPGKIVSVKIVEKAKRITSGGVSQGLQNCWMLEVSYMYSVNGKEYIGTQYSNSPRQESTFVRKAPSEKLKSYLLKYPAGSSVTVRYSAKDPAKALLEVNTTGSTYFAVAAAFALLVSVTLLGKRVWL